MFKDLFPKSSSKTLSADLSSGLVVFLVAIPLCLGIALASGAPIMSGIVAGMVGGIVVGLFGGSALGVSGPAAGLVAIMLDAKDTFTPDNLKPTDGAEIVLTNAQLMEIFQLVLLATLLAGVFQVIMGFLKAGVIAYYIPTSVIKGMLAAIGAIIIFKQIPHAVGYDSDYEGDLSFLQPDGQNTFTEIFEALTHVQLGSVFLFLIAMVVLIAWTLPFFTKRPIFRIISGPLVAVVVGIIGYLVYTNFLTGYAITDSGMVNLSTDNLTFDWVVFPDFSEIANPNVWKYALIIAGVASVESLLCAEATDKMDPHKRITPMNKELRAQGYANIVSGLIGGLPVTQVVVRSSANVQSGGQTRWAAVFHGFLILAAILVLAPLLNMIPKAVLAAVLMIVGYKLLRPQIFVLMWKKGLGQFIPFMVTIVAILMTDLLSGVGIGLAVGAFYILISNFKVPYTYRLDHEEERKVIHLDLSEMVSFLNKGNILSTLREIPDGSKVVVNATNTYFIDPDVQEVLDDFEISAEERGIEYVFMASKDNIDPTKHSKKLRTELENFKSSADS